MALGRVFFRDNSVFSGQAAERVNKYVFRDVEVYFKVKKFISSIVVRYYLYALSNRKPIRQSESILHELYKGYLKNKDVCVVLQDMRKFLLNTSSIPMVSKESVHLVINGFLAVLTIDRKPLGRAPLKSRELLFYNVTDPETPYIKNFFRILEVFKIEK